MYVLFRLVSLLLNVINQQSYFTMYEILTCVNVSLREFSQLSNLRGDGEERQIFETPDFERGRMKGYHGHRPFR